ncbi:hypothetical protein WNA58_003350 [Vibrio cholerae]|uniref:hypothetical protein n=1 Tax=Vibrio paracholerae TaxID=650003 RepID=UPI000DE3DFD0|nr:hypothetical protein [Vibrio paracholerae]EGR2318675.1 hypothetical protein [Vibrio cholerae]EGR4449940.1 hypothetical protein [Vibrio cholerae]EHS1100822.1 hypothetical protein [Vibrio cholerae]EJL6624520.1 hypothetical protein [Vibrio cholerae]EJL6672142.1 hypothetical protein [Vibrio cholerae]
MFKGFNLSLDSLSSLSHNSTYKSQLTANKEEIQNSIKDFILTDGTIDGEKLKKAWFPNIKGAHVFISHSHKDLELAEGLASWLYERFQIHSFIDSHVWGYANDLLKELDNKYALFPSGTSYSYEVRNETTSHVHMMLSSALTEVIDTTECLLFLNTDNAIKNIALSSEADDHRTASPWVMSELATSNIIRKKQNVNRTRLVRKASHESHLLESIDGQESMPLVIHHKAPVEHLVKLTSSDLVTWGNVSSEEHKKYDALTVLYVLFAKERFEIDIPSTSSLEMIK